MGSRLSNGPILNVQAGDAAEVAPIAGDDHGPVFKRDGSKAQIHEADVEAKGLERGKARTGRLCVGQDTPPGRPDDGFAETSKRAATERVLVPAPLAR